LVTDAITPYATWVGPWINVTAGLAGIIAAWLWLRAANADVPAPPGVGRGAPLSASITYDNAKGVRCDLEKTLVEQSTRNRRAALASAATALLTAAAAFLAKLS
jgi:hypothetical protein